MMEKADFTASSHIRKCLHWVKQHTKQKTNLFSANLRYFFEDINMRLYVYKYVNVRYKKLQDGLIIYERHTQPGFYIIFLYLSLPLVSQKKEKENEMKI